MGTESGDGERRLVVLTSTRAGEGFSIPTGAGIKSPHPSSTIPRS
jgi:hypothetical protein